MDDISAGFRIGERLFAWGSLPGEVAIALDLAPGAGMETGFQRLAAACGPTWELDTISMEMTAAAPDRPVTALRYELAALPADTLQPEPDHWMGPLMRLLGAPRTAEHHDLPNGGDPSGSVRFYASWSCGDQSVGLSLYGAPRAGNHGHSSGCLWLNWATVPAARPFVGEWRARAAALAEEARDHSGIVTFALAAETTPARWEARNESVLARDSGYALHTPHLLPTPGTIAGQLGTRGIGLWRSGDHRRWHASTRWDTLSFDMHARVEVDWYDISPAKGGGFSEIATCGWSARDYHGSRAIADAVAALETIAGVTVRRVSGYDC